AETLAAAGNKVFAGARNIAGRNRAVADALRAKGIEPIELDVTSNASVDAAIATLNAKSGGKLDVVINNAGIASAGVSEGFTPEQVRDVFEVNVFGVQRVLRATLPMLRGKGDGLVINIGSILGRVTFPFFGLYGASKFAVEALTDSYRYELSQLGVDVVLVQPSAYPTNMYAAAQQPADAQRGAAYGEIGAIPGKMFETFMGIFASKNAPNPHDVGEAIAKLVATPKGNRPERVVVGQAYGADAVNAAVAPIQRKVVDGLGLGALATIKG
ncbi:MAG: SDR family NAD(P)-dependent oxidoreductase, partial [Proteobacteria bacterium]|nr:SDR family NAD(P)-dependent oxidoreductase [Pseudomonadota bacterium]